MSDFAAAGIETRSRSRSKTPGLLASENGDSNEKRGSKKIPTISLIEEEEDVVEVVSSQQSSQGSQRPKRQRRSAKNTQSDTSNDAPSMDTATTAAVVSNNKQSKTTTVTTTTTIVTTKQQINGSEEKNEQVATKSAKSSTTTATTLLSSSPDVTEAIESQNIFNNLFNAIKTSTPILSSKRTKRITHDTKSTEEIDYNLHPAYKEYKEAGEYWNKFPKTDYTYSELSPHRRELNGGIVAMPNMSRRSLDKYTNRVEAMIQQNPTEESFIRRKFLSNLSYQKRSADLQYDSADEVDVSTLHQKLSSRRYSQTNFFSRIVLYVVGVFSSAYTSVKQKVGYGSKQQFSYTPVNRYHQQGIFRRIYNSAQKFFLLCISKVYLFISTILCLDTWILYSRSENNQENRKRKRFLLGLLALLPLLLFGGTYIYLDPPQDISFPKISLPQLPEISFPKIAFPSISLPKISFDFKLPELSLPSIALPAWFKFPELSLPSFSWPKFDFEWPTLSLPELSWPVWLTLPEFNFSWPTFSLPSWFRFPNFSFYIPDISFSLPEISFAWLKWPEFSFTLPEWVKWPEFTMPTISFDFLTPVWSYTSDAFTSVKTTSVEFLDKIRVAIVGALDEIQIVWNENFNVK